MFSCLHITNAYSANWNKPIISVLQWVHTYVVTQHKIKLKQTNHQCTAVGAYLCGHSTHTKMKQTNHQRTAVGAYLCGHSTQNKLKQTISVLQWVHTYVVTQHKTNWNKPTISVLQWVHTYVVTQHKTNSAWGERLVVFYMRVCDTTMVIQTSD